MSLLRTNTSTSVAGMSSNSWSFTSGTTASTFSTSTSRGPEIDTTSPACSTEVASASMSVEPRRMRSTKMRNPGNSSRTGRPVSPLAASMR